MAKNHVIFDTQAEAGIISTLIYNPTFCLHSEQLKPNHFYNKDSSCLYWAICRLAKKGIENIDSFNLTGTINSNNGIKNMFEKYNINLENYVDMAKVIARPTLEEYKTLVNRIMALAFKRELHKHLIKFDELCENVEQDDISELSGTIYNVLNKLNEEYIFGNTEIKTLGEEIDQLWDEIQYDSQNESNNFKPKIKALHEFYDYSPGSLTLWAARYKSGKSAIAINECLNLANKGAVIGYFDSELSKKEWVVRCLANLTKIPVRTIRQGSYTETQASLLKDALKWFKDKKIIHIYDPVWTNEKIITMSKLLQSKYGMNFLIFDYIKYTSGMNASDTYLKLGGITDTLKNNVGGDLNIPVLSLAQLNRQGEIADSDAIARYVSTVVYWQRKHDDEIGGEDWKKVGNYKAQVRVNRAGRQMSDDEWIHCVFDGDIMTIYQAEVQSCEDLNL